MAMTIWYAMEELDGIVYLECPKPDDAGLPGNLTAMVTQKALS